MRVTARDRGRRTAGAVLLGAALVACGTPAAPGDATGDPPGVLPVREPALVAEGDVVEGVGTVLESPEHGPQLCFSVAESLPPQCSGPEVAGWDWDAVPHESAQGVRWTGSVAVVGRWDGGRLLLTEPPAEPASPTTGAEPPEDEPSSPCPEPEGGWQPVEPARATDEALGVVQEMLGEDASEFAGLWIDQSYLGGDRTSEELEREANDPERFVLNVRTTGDTEAYEERIRDVWGGALCVSPAEHTMAELEAVAEEVPDVVPQDLLVGWGPDVRANRVEVGVVVATEEVQRELHQRFGTDLVTLRGQLQPRA